MTFCLARPNDWTVIVAALAVVTIVVSCEHPVTDPSSSIAQLVVSPQNVTLQQKPTRPPPVGAEPPSPRLQDARSPADKLTGIWPRSRPWLLHPSTIPAWMALMR